VALDYLSGQTGEEMADRKSIANLMKIRALAASLVGPPCAGVARLPAITPDYPWPRAVITSNLDRAARLARDVTRCVGTVFGGWPFTRRWLSMTRGLVGLDYLELFVCNLVFRQARF